MRCVLRVVPQPCPYSVLYRCDSTQHKEAATQCYNHTFLPVPHPGLKQTKDEQVPAVRRGAGRGAVPQPGQQVRVEGVVQGRDAASQRALQLTAHPQGRRVAGWGHWLGNGNVNQKRQKKDFLRFDAALRVARCLRLNSSTSRARLSGGCGAGAARARPTCPPTQTRSTWTTGGWGGCTPGVHWLHHANLDAAPAPTAACPVHKRAAASAHKG